MARLFLQTSVRSKNSCVSLSFPVSRELRIDRYEQAAEPADPSVVNTNDVDKSNIKAGVPDGWAVKGGSAAPSKGTSASAAPASDCAASARSLDRRDTEEIEDILKRLGHIARAVQGMAQ
jgi:hypothetical protein